MDCMVLNIALFFVSVASNSKEALYRLLSFPPFLLLDPQRLFVMPMLLLTSPDSFPFVFLLYANRGREINVENHVSFLVHFFYVFSGMKKKRLAFAALECGYIPFLRFNINVVPFVGRKSQQTSEEEKYYLSINKRKGKAEVKKRIHVGGKNRSTKEKKPLRKPNEGNKKLLCANPTVRNDEIQVRQEKGEKVHGVGKKRKDGTRGAHDEKRV